MLGSSMVCSSQLGWGLASVKRWHVGHLNGMFFSRMLRTGTCQEMACWGLVWYVPLKLIEDWHQSRDVGVWYGMFFSIRLRTGTCQEMACWSLVWYVLLNKVEDWHLSRDGMLKSCMVCSSQVGLGLAPVKRLHIMVSSGRVCFSSRCIEDWHLPWLWRYGWVFGLVTFLQEGMFGSDIILLRFLCIYKECFCSQKV